MLRKQVIIIPLKIFNNMTIKREFNLKKGKIYLVVDLSIILQMEKYGLSR